MNIYFPAKVSNKHIPASDFLQQSPSNGEENCRLGGGDFSFSRLQNISVLETFQKKERILIKYFDSS